MVPRAAREVGTDNGSTPAKPKTKNKNKGKAKKTKAAGPYRSAGRATSDVLPQWQSIGQAGEAQDQCAQTGPL